MIYFTAHTFKCVCHCRRAMFRVLGMYNFGVTEKKFRLKAIKLKIIELCNSKHLALVNKVGDKTQFTISRFHCISNITHLT